MGLARWRGPPAGHARYALPWSRFPALPQCSTRSLTPTQTIEVRMARTGKMVNAPACPIGTNVFRAVAASCGYSARRLARHFGISQRQLQREFMVHMSCSPQAWLRDERMQQARCLLRNASTVKEVAYAMGFSNPSQFCRDFRQRFGCSPSSELRSPKHDLRDLLANLETCPVPHALDTIARSDCDHHCPSLIIVANLRD